MTCITSTQAESLKSPWHLVEQH
jgi:hypothetical protein